MDNNITCLFKAIKFTNKKTMLPELDEYIFIENGLIILQDSHKTFSMNLPILSDKGCFAIRRDDFLKIKIKSGKYFLKDVTDSELIIEAATSKESTIKTIPIIKKYVGLKKVIDTEFITSNSIETNGVNFKAIFKGYHDIITLKFIQGKLWINMEENEVEFNAHLGEMCSADVILANDCEASTTGQSIVDAIDTLGLTKKDNLVSLEFNPNVFVVSKNNIRVYVYSHKL